MKVLVISHSCIVDVNQQLFVSLNALPDTSVALIIPATWKSEYTGAEMTPQYLPGLNVKVHPLPIGRPGQISLHYYKSGLSRVFDEEKPDIVLLDEEPWSLPGLQIVEICRRKKVPYYCYTKQNLYKKYPFPFSAIERRTHRRAAAMMVISQEVEDVLRKKGYTGKCVTLPHACDLRLFYARDTQAKRRELGLRGVVVGYMGRMTPEKGLSLLIEAVSLLKKEKPEREVTVLMVGAGVDEETLKAQIESAGMTKDVVWTGVVPHNQAGEYMALMDIFALPSLTTPRWKEQFGRVIIEALASGVPVAGSDSGQIPHLIRETQGGLVFHEGDSRDLADKLRELIEDADKRHALATQGMAVVRERFTYAAVAKQLRGLLQEGV